MPNRLILELTRIRDIEEGCRFRAESVATSAAATAAVAVAVAPAGSPFFWTTNVEAISLFDGLPMAEEDVSDLLEPAAAEVAFLPFVWGFVAAEFPGFALPAFFFKFKEEGSLFFAEGPTPAGFLAKLDGSRLGTAGLEGGRPGFLAVPGVVVVSFLAAPPPCLRTDEGVLLAPASVLRTVEGVFLALVCCLLVVAFAFIDEVRRISLLGMGGFLLPDALDWLRSSLWLTGMREREERSGLARDLLRLRERDFDFALRGLTELRLAAERLGVVRLGLTDMDFLLPSTGDLLGDFRWPCGEVLPPLCTECILSREFDRELAISLAKSMRD